MSNKIKDRKAAECASEYEMIARIEPPVQKCVLASARLTAIASILGGLFACDTHNKKMEMSTKANAKQLAIDATIKEACDIYNKLIAHIQPQEKLDDDHNQKI